MNGCGVFRGYPYNGLCKDGYDWYASAVRKFAYANEGRYRAGYSTSDYMKCLAAAEIYEELPGSEFHHTTVELKYNGIEYNICARENKTYYVSAKRPGSDKEKELSSGCNLDFTVYKVKMDMWKNREDWDVYCEGHN